MQSRQEARTAEVTVVVPNYNGAAYLERCLSGIWSQTIPVKVIAVDNASTDGSRSILERAEAAGHLRLIREEQNTGFAFAVNVGIQACDTDYILLLNNDAILAPDAAEQMLAAIQRDPKIFSVSARMMQMHDPDHIDDSGDLFCALGWAFSPGRDALAQGRFLKPCDVTSACAGAALYRRSAFEQVGLFDPNHFCYLEDVDLGWRARILGFRNVYEPSAEVLHAGSAVSGSRHNAFKSQLTAANTLYMIHKNMAGWQKLLNAPLLLAGILIKQVYFARKGLGWAYCQGLLRGMAKIRRYGSSHKVRHDRETLRHELRLQLEFWANCVRRVSG